MDSTSKDTPVFEKSATVVDMHCHLAGLGYGESGCFVSDALNRSFKLPFFLHGFGVSRQQLETNGDMLVADKLAVEITASKFVDGAVVVALDGVYDPADKQFDFMRTEMYVPNDFVAQAAERHKNLYFGASINPMRPDALDALAMVAETGAVLVKWLPNIQGFDPANTKYVPFYKALAKTGLPLLTHMGNEETFTRSEDEYGEPDRFRLALDNGVTVIAAHAATTGAKDGKPHVFRLLELCKDYPNLWIDISALTQFNRSKFLPLVLENTGLYSRLLYGTDHPLHKTALCTPAFHFSKIGIGNTLTAYRMLNPWDRDVFVKRLLGVPNQVFNQTAGLLNIS